jgi:hypothetical protein
MGRVSLGMRWRVERNQVPHRQISDVTKTSFWLPGTRDSAYTQPFSITMTDVLSVPQWSQGFGDLHNLIAETLRSPSPPAIRRLRQGIEAYRPQFLQLLDDPPKNQEHRNTINSGKFDRHANKLLSNNVY